MCFFFGRAGSEDDEDSDVSEEEEEENEQSSSWTVEHARSGRSQCRGCGSNIANKLLRIGEEVENADYGYQSTRWFHCKSSCISVIFSCFSSLFFFY